jgi:hypothetical protein
LFIAGIAAVISYNDGLFVARLAGNHDRQAYLYPLLPDGFLVVCLLVLVEGARMRPAKRSGWATWGLVLGIGMTLAMNAGAGYAHSVLDAVIDALVPVVFFITVEVVLWHVRHSRGDDALKSSSDHVPGTVPSSSFEAAKARMELAAGLGFRYSDNQARDDYGLTRGEAAEARRQVTPERGRGGPAISHTAPAAVPAGDAACPPAGAPAGASPNGRAHGS